MSSFRFKEFEVAQDMCAMKVGTDGVLLGAWAMVDGTEQNILDIGTGTGLIALMMAQRTTAQNIVGVEIDPQAAKQASENMRVSKWSARLSLQHSAIQSYMPDAKFDLILSNPPYFVDSLLAKGESRTKARHTTELSFNDLVDSVIKLLTPKGRFVVILPTTETGLLDDVIGERLHLVRRCMVHGKVGGSIKRVISEYSIYKYPQTSETQLAIRDIPPNDYTPEYRELTANFYLKF